MWFQLLMLGLALFTGMAPKARAAQSAHVNLATVSAPAGVQLEDILANRVGIGFTPVLTDGLAAHLFSGNVVWVRLRADLPERKDGDWLLRLPRVPIARAALQLPNAAKLQAQTGAFGRSGEPTVAGALLLPLPAGPAETVTLFLRLEGQVRAGIHPLVVSRHSADLLGQAERKTDRLAWFFLLGIMTLALVRRFLSPASGTLRVALAAFTVLLALMASSGDLYLLPGGAHVAALGNLGMAVLWLLPVGPLLLAVAMFSGLSRSAPRLNGILTHVGWAWVPLMLLALLAPSDYAESLQLVGWAAWLTVALFSMFSIAMDQRIYRVGALSIWLALMAAVAMRVLVDMQLIETGRAAMYAFEPLLVFLLAFYLGMPWIRARSIRHAALRLAAVPEPSVVQAREELLKSLESGLDNPIDGGDVRWIAFRRLLEALKPVLDQTSSAVLLVGHRGQDLLQAEPRSAESSYRELLAQRAQMLRNLSRSHGPQQVSLGHEDSGKLQRPVQMAIIPLPINKPGWGLLLVEREAGLLFTDAELAMCAEFASLATVACESAADLLDGRIEVEPFPSSRN